MLAIGRIPTLHHFRGDVESGGFEGLGESPRERFVLRRRAVNDDAKGGAAIWRRRRPYRQFRRRCDGVYATCSASTTFVRAACRAGMIPATMHNPTVSKTAAPISAHGS